MRRTLLPLLVLVVLATACGNDDDEASPDDTGVLATTSTTEEVGGEPDATTTTAERPEADGEPASTVCDDVAAPGDEVTKPDFVVPSGLEPPEDLVIVDIEEGDGPEVVEGSQVDVHYIGKALSDGLEFDASYDGSPFPLSIPDQVIDGWNQGVPGMKEGGRRCLVIPPELGYGPSGIGPIGPNETLIFVIDALEVTGP